MCSADFFLAFLAVLFPPVSVWVKRGICSADSLINIALCCLGYLPGLIHAWYIISKYPEEESSYQPLEAGSSYPPPRVYCFGPQGGPGHHACPGPRPQAYSPAPPPQPQGQQYGAFQQQHPSSSAQQPQAKYSDYQQQTLVEGHSGPSNGGVNGQGGLPSYAEVVKGDFKVQTQD